MNRQNLRSARRLKLESLEGRSLMAGVVFVSVVQGDLILTGDGADNEIQLLQSEVGGVPTPGRYFIAAQNGTILRSSIPGFNGFVNNITDDIRINMNNGNDRVTLGRGVNGSFIAPDDLEINLSEGNNTLLLDRVIVRDDVAITSAGGADTITVRASVGSEPGVDGGLNDLSISTGNRNDVVRIENSFVRNNLTVDAVGTDAFTDIVDFIVGNVGGDTVIRTGAGTDLIRLSEVTFNDDLTVDAGTGNDTVTLARIEVDELIALLGTGNDRLTLTGTRGRRAALNGGSDVDRLDLSGDSQFTQFPAPQNFETINFI